MSLIDFGKNILTKFVPGIAGAAATFAVGFLLNKAGLPEFLNEHLHNYLASSIVTGVLAGVIVGGATLLLTTSLPIISGVLIGGLIVAVYTYGEFKGKGPGEIKKKGQVITKKSHIQTKLKVSLVDEIYNVKFIIKSNAENNSFMKDTDVEMYILKYIKNKKIGKVEIFKHSPPNILEWLIPHLNAKNIKYSFYGNQESSKIINKDNSSSNNGNS